MITLLIQVAVQVVIIALGIALYVAMKSVFDSVTIKIKKFYKRNKRRFKNWLAERKKSA